MKYIEQAKSLLLFLLVTSSIVLTFIIWTYTPDYKSIEQTANNITEIGKKKNVESVIKPAKLLYRQNDEFKGTFNPSMMNDVLDSFRNWQDMRIEEREPNLSAARLNNLIRDNQRITVDFSGPVPFSVFNKTFLSSENEMPETTFDSLIIDWKSYKDNQLQLFFISASNSVMHRAQVTLIDATTFYDKLIEPSNRFADYREIERTATTSLYVPEEPVEALQYKYYTDDISPNSFKNILFTKPSIVQRNVDDVGNEKYTDGMGLMTVDTYRRAINYVYPAAGSRTIMTATELMDKSFEFINEHGGLTADYRLTSISPETSRVNYQLYLQGYPVFSDTIATDISTTWGQKRIFRYDRPYYSLDIDFTSANDARILPSGVEIVQQVQQYKDIVFSEVDDIRIGYDLTRDEEKQLLVLEPAWYVVTNNEAQRITDSSIGGDFIGLE